MSTANHYILSEAHPEAWAHAEHLLPGYLKKNLTPHDQKWMEEWINQIQTTGGAVAKALTSEVDWVRAAQEEFASQTYAFNADVGWEKLQTSLQAEPSQGIGTTAASATLKLAPSLTEQLKQWLAKLVRMQKDAALHWWQKPAFAALGAAICIGQMVFLTAAIQQGYTLNSETTIVMPSSGASRPMQGIVFKVVFKPKASTTDIMDALNKVQGRIVGGPGALGLWDIEVPSTLQATALQMLTESSAVESVSQE